MHIISKTKGMIHYPINQFKTTKTYLEMIQLVRTQNFPKNKHFLLPDTHT